MRSPEDVIIKPLVTEKSTGKMAEGKYYFMVNPHANKQEIRYAVETLFKVKVKDVNTSRMRGKMRRVGVHQGRKPDWKKAVVTLVEGQSIQFFEGM